MGNTAIHMIKSKFFRKYASLNYLILSVLILLLFSVVYFLYRQFRTQSAVYISVSLIRPTNISVNILSNSVPYWVGNSISIGDKEINPLGGVNAEVVSKDSFEALNYGQFVNLLLKVNAVRDRSGIYLYRNKPLSVGSLIDLKLTNTQTNGMITYIGLNKPEIRGDKLNVTLYTENEVKWKTDNLKKGSEIKDTGGNVIAQITDISTGPVKNTGYFTSGSLNPVFISGISSDRVNAKITVELKARQVGEVYYFMDSQKVKAGENIILPFSEITLNYPITGVVKL